MARERIGSSSVAGGDGCGRGLRWSRPLCLDGPAASWEKLAASPNHDKGGNKGMSWLKQVYCRWPVACSLSATLQKQLRSQFAAYGAPHLIVDNMAPTSGGSGDGGEIGAGPSGTRTGPDFIETRLL
jgi:hypothetical protein